MCIYTCVCMYIYIYMYVHTLLLIRILTNIIIEGNPLEGTSDMGSQSTHYGQSPYEDSGFERV